MKPKLSKHFEEREPSDIRLAQIEFAKRTVKPEAINVAIGNVSLPMHPAMQERKSAPDAEDSPFKDGVMKYSPTVGFEETNKAFLNIIASSGFKTEKLHSQITVGGSQAMELLILGVCGPAGTREEPLLLIDPAYTNYKAMAERAGRATISIQRHLQENGKFTLPEIKGIEKIIREHKPGAMLVIPYDNPTGQFYDNKTMVELGKLCVKYNLWMVSDEAYRELYYVKNNVSSIWGLTNKEVPGIEGRRISIESASKVWNACGLRIGAIVTDHFKFHKKAVAENTANLCPPVSGQYIFGALAHVSHPNLQRWYSEQRKYYKPMLSELTNNLRKRLPGVIVSSPDASIYSVIDVRNIAKLDFDAVDFVLYCSREGAVDVNGKELTLLVAPMAGFYSVKKGEPNPGKTQMRIAYVETPENMKLVPLLFTELFKKYELSR